MEVEGSLIKLGRTSLAVIVPHKWAKKKGLKKGDRVKMIVNEKILIDKATTEDEAHAEILAYEKQLETEKKMEEALTSREKGKVVSEALKEHLI